MQHSNMRRRVVAALAAGGFGSLAGITRASAQGETSIATVACEIVSNTGTFENVQPNYIARASRADFAFLAPMHAIGDNIVLYSAEIGGEKREAVAAIKGVLTRAEDGTVAIDQLEIAAPFTALSQDGQYYGIVQMAHDQNAPVGLSFLSGETALGDTVFDKAAFDPAKPGVSFDAAAAAPLHAALMSDAPFQARLVAGGQIFSTIAPPPGAYRAFIEDTLLPAMDEARQKDIDAPCIYSDSYADGLENCFLTSACCAVIGLADDCWELSTLRRFRDGYMQGFAAGRADIARYYAEAPAIARALVASPAGRRRLLGLYWRTILPAVLLARLGANRAAYRLYRRMMLELLPARPA